MNAFETAILVIILLMLVIIYVDVLNVSQQMSTATAVTNYISRTIERQGGMLNYVPTNFATYGHGSYTTSENAYKIISKNLEKMFGEDCIVHADDPSTYDRPIEITIKLVQSDPASMSEANKGVETIHFDDKSCFGIYLGGTGNDGSFNEDSKGFISIESLKYYKPYYLVTVKMKYNMWIVPTVVTSENASIKDMLLPEETHYDFEKTFTRIVVPSYYIQEENYNSDKTDNDNFFVV